MSVFFITYIGVLYLSEIKRYILEGSCVHEYKNKLFAYVSGGRIKKIYLLQL